MKHIGELIKVGNMSVAREEKQTYTTIDPLSAKLVEYVFAKFYMLCRGTDVLYADPKRLLAEKTQWQSTFTREGYSSVDHIRKALLKLERHRYPNPPQLGEFLAWNESTPDDLGLLTKEQAFNRSAEYMRDGDLKDLSAEQNMLLGLAVKESDRYFLRNNAATKTQPVFYRNYEIILRNFLAGKIEPVPKGIEDKHEETQELKKQDDIKKDFDHLVGYEQCMPEIRKMLGINPDGTTNTPVKRR
jgi:hypothetical protein